MDKDLALYELRSKLYHLDTDIDDELISFILSNRNFQGYEKMDILYIINLATFSSVTKDYSDEEMRKRCDFIIDKLNNLSQYKYSETEIIGLKLLYFINTKKLFTDRDEVQQRIEELESIIIDDISELSLSMAYLNEELRMALLNFYHAFGDNYDEYYEKIQFHLNIAQEQVPLRLKVAEILGGA